MEALNGRTSETITIDVSEMRNLRGSKGESYTLFAKIEFDGKVIGETPKVEAVDKEASFSYTCTMECCLSDDASAKITLDDIASKPLLVSFIEVLPKEKKQKEEKTQLLGQCTIDMLPLVRSCTTEISDCQFICPVALLDGNKTSGSVIAPPVERTTITSQGNSESDISKPEAEIIISVVTPLLDEEMIKNTNLFTVRAGSAYSLPDGFLANSSNHTYGIGFPVTVSSKETYLYFNGGSAKLAHEKEARSRRLKWYNVNTTAPGSQYISGLTYEKVPREDENGDFSNTNQNEEFRYEAENERPRVTWDIEKRVFLDVDGKSTFRSMITHKRILPVDIFRIVNEKPKDKTAVTKKEKMAAAAYDTDDHSHLLYHGVCYVDMGTLLYPGVCKIAGAFKVHPYNETQVEKKTGRRSTLAQEEIFKVHQKGPSISPVHNRNKNQVASKKTSVMVREPDSNGSIGELDNAAPDAKEYQDFNSFLYLELSLSRPLIPKRKVDELSRAISQMIPPRPIVKLQVGGAEKALKDYHSQLTSVAHMVLDDFRKMYGRRISKDELDFNPEEQIKRKRELYYELNTSGKYFAYKEQLKHSIVKIVREKFMKTSVFSSPEDLQQFLSELYVYLIDQMHVCLGKFLSLNEDNPQIKNPEITSSQLKQFAEEAFDEGNFEQASAYFKQRIVKNDRDATCWLDFGIYHLHMRDVIKAKECFKESIALDQNFTEGLIMHGIVSTLETNFEEAELVLERSTNLAQPTENEALEVAPYLPWVVLGVFYEFSDNTYLAEHAFREGSKIAAGLNIKEARDDTCSKKEELDVVNKMMKSNSVVSFSKHPGGSLKVKTNTMSAKPALSTLSNKHETQDQHTEEKSEEASNEPRMYLLAADWLITRYALNYAECLLSRELVTFGGSVEYYTLLSRLHARQGNHQLASEAISKAIALDIENAESWAVSGHLAHSSGDVNTMRDCYERTIAFVTDASRMHTILLRLGAVYLDEEKYLKAKQTYLMASKYAFTCRTWLGVGMSCYRLGELDEAEEALSEANVLNNTNPVVWGFLALVTMRTHRKLEAEQCFKFATKLGLSDEKLLNEIEQLQRELGWGNPSFVTF